MPSYATGSRKANAEIDIAVTAALQQVMAAPIPLQDRLEYGYLIVREKLDRMEQSGVWDNLPMGVSDTMVCEAAITVLAKKIGVKDPSLVKDYPNDLPELRRHGLSLVP